MHIEGIPESVNRGDYQRLIEGLGLDVNSTRSIDFRADGFYVSVYAKHGERRRILTDNGFGETEAAVHRVFVPVVD